MQFLWLYGLHSLIITHVRIQRGDRGSGPPLKNHKNIGFLSNTGLDPLKITKLPCQHSMLGHHQHTSKMPFKWRFADGPMARLKWYLYPPSPHQLKNEQKKHTSQLDPPPPTLTKLSGSAHVTSLWLRLQRPLK